MRRRAAIAGAIAVAALTAATASATPAAGVRKAYLYKVTLSGTVKADVNGSASPDDLAHARNTVAQTASWTFHTQATRIWIVAFDGLHGYTTEASAADHESSTGQIRSSETFTYFDHTKPNEPLQGTSDCHATVDNAISAKLKATATSGGTTFDVDLAGTFHPTGRGALTCADSPQQRTVQGQPTGPSPWGFSWNPDEPASDANQRMELGDTILPFQVGLRSIGLTLQDYSLVEHAEVCPALALDCTVTFTLGGEAELTRVCATTVTGAGTPTCGSSGKGPTTPPKKQNPPPPPGGGAHTPPTLSGLTVSPHSFSLGQPAKIAYRVDRTGTVTLIQVVRKLTIPGIGKVVSVPVEVFRHTNTARTVSFDLPKSFAGHALTPGHYTLEAAPLDTSAGTGTQVTTTFDITP